MEAGRFIQIIGADFFTGVPDSQLKSVCDFLMETYGIDPKHHVITANEGNAVATASGYHMATGKVPVVYMQNSGEGNVINPVASLTNKEVYAIPMLFLIGWRGEPGVHDEPQHIYQGKITLQLLEDMDIAYFIIDKDTTEEEIEEAMKSFRNIFDQGKSAAFVIRKGALKFEKQMEYSNQYQLIREEVIECIAACAGKDPIVSTTGKISRELYEIRERRGEGHQQDFLTVGSMGHNSSIAFGIAMQKPEQKIWCIDGDGALLMHMGTLAVIGNCKPSNLIHVVINNEAHETVGGMPTVSGTVKMPQIAMACGYERAYTVEKLDELETVLRCCREEWRLTFIEIKVAIGSRSDLGRPAGTPEENKKVFMKNLETK